jgi:hypothetical protein
MRAIIIETKARIQGEGRRCIYVSSFVELNPSKLNPILLFFTRERFLLPLQYG